MIPDRTPWSGTGLLASLSDPATGDAVGRMPMAPDAPVGALVVLALLGIAVAALLSAGANALSRLTRAAAADLAAAGHRGSHAVQRLADHPARAAAAATYFRLLAEMMAASCITLVVAASLRAWWHVLLVSLAVTVVVLWIAVGASLRGAGRRRPADVLTFLAPMMLALSWLGVPGEKLRLWERSGRTAHEEAEEAAEELRDMVDRVSESEQIEADEREMLQSVFALGRTLTREVMVPRTEMVTMSADSSVVKALKLFVRSGYSRVPVVGDSVDDVVGVLYLKDVLGRVQLHPEAGEEPVPDIVRSPVYVPEMKPVDDLMREMQQSSTHMALVVDEFGGISGLVTIEDCLEEIVGELRDEHDPAEQAVAEVADGVWRVPARTPVDELGAIFGLELHDDEVDTAGGLLAKALGKVPIAGAAADIHGLHLVAERAEGRRRQVATLLVSALERLEEEEVAPPDAEATVEIRRQTDQRPTRPAPERGSRPAAERSTRPPADLRASRQATDPRIPRQTAARTAASRAAGSGDLVSGDVEPDHAPGGTDPRPVPPRAEQ